MLDETNLGRTYRLLLDINIEHNIMDNVLFRSGEPGDDEPGGGDLPPAEGKF